MTSLLLTLALLQGNGPTLEASVDEERVSVGEDLVYTLRAVSHSRVPMQVTVAPFTGLEIVSRSERSEVAMGHDPRRTTVLEVRRLNLADGEPFARVTVWCPDDLGAQLSRADVERAGALAAGALPGRGAR